MNSNKFFFMEMFAAIFCLASSLSSCCAQETPKFVVINEEIPTLEKFQQLYKIELDFLKKNNPQLVGKKLKKGDTVYLLPRLRQTVITEVPTPSPTGNYKKSPPLKTTEATVELEYKGRKYWICSASPKIYNIEIFSKNGKTGNYHNFRTVAKAKGEELLFAINGGMFNQDYSPVGLLIANNKEEHTINLDKRPEGNFYVPPPNGVFFLDNQNNAKILPSENYTQGHFSPKLATQSGPMMVINGNINQGFNKNSQNFNIRNGVGTDDKGNVHFVISIDKVTFYEFSELFKDYLKCSNALYLDGAISEAYIPSWNSDLLEDLPQLGPILTVSSGKNHPTEEDKVTKQNKEDHIHYLANNKGSYAVATVNPKINQICIIPTLGKSIWKQVSSTNTSQEISFIMNGGPFSDNTLQPLGLVKDNGKEFSKLKLEKLEGSNTYFFNIKPNGVFFLDGENNPYIEETSEFIAKNDLPIARTAIQAGPILIQNGILNSQIEAISNDKTIKSGLGIRQGKLIFVVATTKVSLLDFANFFKVELGCSDAMLLDSDAGRIYSLSDVKKNKQIGKDLANVIIVTK